MKKRSTILWMLAALALLAVLVPLASRVPGGTKQEVDTSAELSLDTEAITGFSLDAGERLTFRREGERWVYEADPAFPLDQQKVETMLDTLSSLHADKTIDRPEALSGYGLDIPLCRVEAGELVLSVGKDAAMDGGRYFSTGDGKVYITADDILTPFRYSLLELAELEAAPAMQTLESVTLERQGREPLVIRSGQGQNLCYSPDYIWFGEKDGAPMPLDTERTQELIRHGTDMTWEGCADYRAEDLSAYGLDHPTLLLTIEYTEPEAGTYTLEVGTAVSGQYYARMGDSRVIYWMDAVDVNALLEADVGALYPNEVLLMDWSRVSAVTAELAGERYTFTPALREKEQQEAAEEVTEGEMEQYWLLRGEEAALGEVLDRLTAMVPTGSAEGAEPVLAQELRITAKQDNPNFPEVTVAFYRATAEDCLVTLNGRPTVYVPRSEVSALYEQITRLVL